MAYPRRLNTNFIRSKEEEEAVAAAAAAWAEPQKKKQPFASFLCFDVEATCEAGTNFNFPNEIIVRRIVVLHADGRNSRWSYCDGRRTSPPD